MPRWKTPMRKKRKEGEACHALVLHLLQVLTHSAHVCHPLKEPHEYFNKVMLMEMWEPHMSPRLCSLLELDNITPFLHNLGTGGGAVTKDLTFIGFSICGNQAMDNSVITTETLLYGLIAYDGTGAGGGGETVVTTTWDAMTEDGARDGGLGGMDTPLGGGMIVMIRTSFIMRAFLARSSAGC